MNRYSRKSERIGVKLLPRGTPAIVISFLATIFVVN